MRTFVLVIIAIIASLNLSAQKSIPSTELKTLEGKKVNIQDLATQDRPVVIALWATWCVPCINELNTINDIYDDMRDEVDFELVAISVDDARTAKSVKPFVYGKGWEFDILLDTNNDLKRALGAASVPATFVIKDGEIVKKKFGYKPGDEDDLLEYLKAL